MIKIDINIHYCEPELAYRVTKNITSKGFTNLMLYTLYYKAYGDSIFESIKEELSKSPNTINVKNNKGYSALAIACLNVRRLSNIKVVKYLINKGADINSINNKGINILNLCLVNSEKHFSDDLIKLLIKSGADTSQEYRNLPILARACLIYNNCVYTNPIKILLESGISANSFVKKINMPILHYACYIGCPIKIIKYLVDNGANVDEMTPGNDSCLMCLYKNQIDNTTLYKLTYLMSKVKERTIKHESNNGNVLSYICKHRLGLEYREILLKLATVYSLYQLKNEKDRTPVRIYSEAGNNILTGEEIITLQTGNSGHYKTKNLGYV